MGISFPLPSREDILEHIEIEEVQEDVILHRYEDAATRRRFLIKEVDVGGPELRTEFMLHELKPTLQYYTRPDNVLHRVTDWELKEALINYPNHVFAKMSGLDLHISQFILYDREFDTGSGVYYSMEECAEVIRTHLSENRWYRQVNPTRPSVMSKKSTRQYRDIEKALAYFQVSKVVAIPGCVLRGCYTTKGLLTDKNAEALDAFLRDQQRDWHKVKDLQVLGAQTLDHIWRDACSDASKIPTGTQMREELQDKIHSHAKKLLNDLQAARTE